MPETFWVGSRKLDFTGEFFHFRMDLAGVLTGTPKNFWGPVWKSWRVVFTALLPSVISLAQSSLYPVIFVNMWLTNKQTLFWLKDKVTKHTPYLKRLCSWCEVRNTPFLKQIIQLRILRKNTSLSLLLLLPDSRPGGRLWKRRILWTSTSLEHLEERHRYLQGG